MTQITELSFDAAGFESFVDAQHEPGWLTELRREAWHHAEAMAWPQRREEEWIRTDIRAFQIKKFAVPAPNGASQPAEGGEVATSELHQLTHGVDLAGSMETFDSRVTQQQLDPSLAEKGVVFGSLQQIAETHPQLVRPHLFTAFDPDYDKFAALHAAFWSGGQFLYVPRGVVIDRPIHIGSVLSDGGTDT